MRKARKIFHAAFKLMFLVAFCFSTIQLFAQNKPAQPSGKKANRILYGQASYYSNKFNGRKTASGERFSQAKLTAACNVLPLGTWIKVTNLRNGKSIVVKTNDRLHAKMKRIVDLTSEGAARLGYISSGLTRVKVEVLGKKKP